MPPASNQPDRRSGEPPRIGRHVFALLVTAGLVVAAYSNAPRGQFVYDDTKQILQNHLIQHSQYYRQALTSDVWAFKGVDKEGRSNYWRPTFVALNIACFAAFGKDPFGWHVVNILLHGAVCMLVYCVLLKLGSARRSANAVIPARGRGHADPKDVGMAHSDARVVGVQSTRAPRDTFGDAQDSPIPWAVAAAVTWLFAAHPVHVESVTWVAGSPDLLVGVGLLGAYLCFLAARRGPTVWNVGGMILLYAFAQFAKEAAIVFPVIVILTGLLLPERGARAVESALRAFVLAIPLIILAALFVVARQWILGFTRIELPWAPTLAGVLLTMPSLLAFYLRQAVFPWTLGPQYPLRVVAPGALTGANFYLPLAICVATLVLFVWLARRRPGYRIGLLWFALPILLALDIRSFRPEELVHDRYLYLPLMGFLMLVCLLVHDGIARLARHRGASTGLIAASLAVAGVLAMATHRYNPVWGDELALWTRATQVDPTSAMAFGQLGAAHYQAEKKTKICTQSKAAYVRALKIFPDMTQAHLGLGFIANCEGRPAEAQQYFERVLASWPDDVDARDNLALAFQMQGRFDDGIRVLDEGRRRTPYRYAKYTVNLAVLHVLAKRMGTAISELEAIREPRMLTVPEGAQLKEALNNSLDPDVLLGWRHLARLYAQTNRPADALAACDTYLQKTSPFSSDPLVAPKRSEMESLRSTLTVGPR